MGGEGVAKSWVAFIYSRGKGGAGDTGRLSAPLLATTTQKGTREEKYRRSNERPLG